MKKILYTVFCFCIIINTNAQMQHTSSNPANYKVDAKLLFEKARTQNTVAWILLGGGAGLVLTAMTIMTGEEGKEAARARGGRSDQHMFVNCCYFATFVAPRQPFLTNR